MGMLSVIGKGLAKKAGKDTSKDVAKRGTELIGRRPTKDMGMVDEVTPKRLTYADKAEETKKSGKGAAVAAGVAAGAAGATALMASRGGKDEGKNEEGRGRSYQDERPVRDAGRVAVTTKAEASAERGGDKMSFSQAFREARKAGDKTFTFEGKKYTTELAEEKKASAPAPKKEAESGVREGRNENIDEDTRKRAMASVANLAKGGMVVNKGIGASMTPHNIFGKKKK